VDARELFEAELARRGLRHADDDASGRFVVWVSGQRLPVSLDNLGRQLAGDDGDARRVAWFTDQVLATAAPAVLSADGLYWHLEPNDYQDAAEYRAAVTLKLDRVLVHADPGGELIRWITPRDLSELGLTAREASERAWSNLDAAVRRAAQVTTGPVDGVTLLGFAMAVPSCASLLLAPSLRDAVTAVVGWPVLAVAPERDFVYIWSGGHRELISRLGTVVMRTHRDGPYPLSTEVLEIGDTIRAIGSYST
jgi:hypothetical protein